MSNSKALDVKVGRVYCLISSNKVSRVRELNVETEEENEVVRLIEIEVKLASCPQLTKCDVAGQDAANEVRENNKTTKRLSVLSAVWH